MKKSRKHRAQGERVPLTEAEVEALCNLPDADFEQQKRAAFPDDYPPAGHDVDEMLGEWVAHERELQKHRDAHGGWLGDESWSRGQMTPEEEAEANRLVDEAIEADRRTAEG